jgi:hypothetical protein
MKYRDPANKRRELFLHQFHLTAKVVFIGKKSGWRSYAGKKLVDLARAHLSVPETVPPFKIYADLAYVHRVMTSRQTGWNRNIDFAPADFE